MGTPRYTRYSRKFFHVNKLRMTLHPTSAEMWEYSRQRRKKSVKWNNERMINRSIWYWLLFHHSPLVRRVGNRNGINSVQKPSSLPEAKQNKQKNTKNKTETKKNRDFWDLILTQLKKKKKSNHNSLRVFSV